MNMYIDSMEATLPCQMIFTELPKATIISVSRPDVKDITPMLLSYAIEFQYKQFRWRLVKKATQVLYLHLALKKRALIEEFHEKQEHVREWIQNLGLVDHATIVQGEDEAHYVALTTPYEDQCSSKNRYIPTSAALPIIKPSLGRHHSVSDTRKVAMQGYLNHFLGNLDIVNSHEVCQFLEVSILSFSPEYGPKLKEGYVRVRDLPKIPKDANNDDTSTCGCNWFNRYNGKQQMVWAVLKPGFLAFLSDPFDAKLVDILIFDVLRPLDGSEQYQVLAKQRKGHNPLRFAFKVTCSNRSVKLRTRSSAAVDEWVSAINHAAFCPMEGWCRPHRFDSFAPPRGLIEDDNLVQWFVDGEAAFEAIASAIEGAKSEIFITDWWLCPELFLRRPFEDNESSRLDLMLKAKAEQGVKIYILLYKEVPLALKINSLDCKQKLLSIHENMKVQRYPDYFPSRVYLWSHHEKIVIVDNQICFLGGLDLCYGRYDNCEHKVGDFPSQIWPGKDYYNPRESEPDSWKDNLKDVLDRKRYPRMPWHDIHCALWGPVCHDVARHFVQRWNYAKRTKAQNKRTIPLLIPQQHMVIPHYLGKSAEMYTGEDCKHIDTKRLDSFSRPSQYIPLLLPQESDISVMVNGTQSLDSKHGHLDQKIKMNQIHSFSPKKIEVDQLDGDIKVEVMDDGPSSCPHPNEYKQDVMGQHPNQISDKKWWEAQDQGSKVVSTNEERQAGPRAECRCQVIRSIGPWSVGASQREESIHNAYISAIEDAEHCVYIENQFFISGLSDDVTIKNRVSEAIYRRILRAEKENKCFRVIVVLPLLPGFQGGMDDGGAASVRAVMHWQYRTICRGPNSILHNLYNILGPKTENYISFYGLRTYGRLSEGGHLVTNQIYVHSKLMLVDDRVALLGSANINDRSLLGSRDSEIGILIEDKEFVDSYMNSKPWKAGKFCLSLRLSLWMEHLGLHAGESIRVRDPIVDSTYKDIWMETAKTNTNIYQEVFSCIPNDEIRSRYEFRQSTNYWKEKIGYIPTDLGVALDSKEPSKSDDHIEDMGHVERLKSIRGHLVCLPLNFMCNEDLRPAFSEGEFYINPHIFH